MGDCANACTGPARSRRNRARRVHGTTHRGTERVAGRKRTTLGRRDAGSFG